MVAVRTKIAFFGNAADTAKFVAFGISGSERKISEKIDECFQLNFQLND